MRKSPLAQLSELRNWRLRRAEADAARQAYVVAAAQETENAARTIAGQGTRALNARHSEMLEQARTVSLTRGMIDAGRDVLAALEGELRRSELELQQAQDVRKAEEEQLRFLNVVRFEKSKAAEALQMMIRRETARARRKADAAEEERQDENFIALLQMNEGRR
jgi:hypothetical protein